MQFFLDEHGDLRWDDAIQIVLDETQLDRVRSEKQKPKSNPATSQMWTKTSPTISTEWRRLKMSKLKELLLSDNIRRMTGDDDELHAALQEFGWVPEFPALLDEHDVVLVGHRRLAIAKELEIKPVIKHLTLGSGDAADCERLKLAIVSNIGGAPITKADRQRIDERAELARLGFPIDGPPPRATPGRCDD